MSASQHKPVHDHAPGPGEEIADLLRADPATEVQEPAAD